MGTQLQIHILCDRHPSTTMEAVIVEDRKQEAMIDPHACSSPGCVRHYHPDSGYFDVVNGKLLMGPPPGGLACAEHDTALYVASDEPETNKQLWRCPKDGCSTERTL